MPFQIRATFFFKDVANHGWSETIHHTATDLPTVLAAARTLQPLRRDLLGDESFMVQIRVSDDLIKRDSLIFQVPVGDQAGQSFGDLESSSANLALVVRIGTADFTKRRTLYLSGVPHEVLGNAGTFTPVGGFGTKFDRYAAGLVSGGWAVRNKSGFFPARNIVNVVQNAGSGNVTITTDVSHGFNQGTVVIMRGTGLPALNGTFPCILPITSTTFTVHLNTLLGLWPGLGIVTQFDMVLTPITSAQVIRGNHRNRGRPFDSPRGRRKARTRR